MLLVVHKHGKMGVAVTTGFLRAAATNALDEAGVLRENQGLVSASWVGRFMRRNNLSRRRNNNTKVESVEDRLEDIERFYGGLQSFLDSKGLLLTPENYYNVDQVPGALDNMNGMTIAVKGSRVRIVRPSNGKVCTHFFVCMLLCCCCC